MKNPLANAAWFLSLMLTEILREPSGWQIAKIASDGCITNLQMARMLKIDEQTFRSRADS